MGSFPEPFDGKPEKAEAFWSSLENFFYLNDTLYANESKRVSAALTMFKLGTPAGEWARDRQKTALEGNPVTFGTWDDFKAAFKKHFIPAEAQLEAITAMHSLRMGTRPFNDWYQEWSNYAARTGVDDNTKMYAFRRAIPQALHQKILGITPAPNTLEELVDKARDFDRVWRLYNNPAFAGPRGPGRGANIRATESDENQIPQINLFTGSNDQSQRRGPLSKAEKDRRFKEKLCFYCAKPNHTVKECREKQKNAQASGSSNRFPPRKDAKARALNTQEQQEHKEDDVSPAYEDHVTVSRLYQDTNRFGISRPKSAPVNEDF